MPCSGCLGCAPGECGAFPVALGQDKRLVAPPGHHPVSLPSTGLLPIIPPCHSDSVTGTAPLAALPSPAARLGVLFMTLFLLSRGSGWAGTSIPRRLGLWQMGNVSPRVPPALQSPAVSPPRAGGDRCCHMFCSWILPPGCARAACTGTLPWAQLCHREVSPRVVSSRQAQIRWPCSQIWTLCGCGDR